MRRDDVRLLEGPHARTRELLFLLRAVADFLRQRTRPAWNRSILPALRDWCVEGLRVDNSA